MFAENIPLRFAGPGQVACLREMTGRDEYSVEGTDTANAISLLGNLLHVASNAKTVSAADLVASDRDFLLAAVYKRAFGDRIEGTLSCAQCDQPFDLNFSLVEVMESVAKRKRVRGLIDLNDGYVKTAKGARFRLPTGNDELAVVGLSPDEAETLLLSRCAESDEWQEERIDLENFLEQVAPLIDLELVARCAECGHRHTVHFDIQTYLLGAIASERRRLLSDINCIAGAYSWSLDEILSLTRSDRRHLVELIENQYAA